MKKKAYRLYTWLVYTVLWGMVWAYPVLMEALTAVRIGTSFHWADILHAWTSIAPFFLLFILHRLPVYRLLLRHRVRAYCISVSFMLALFVAGNYLSMKPLRRPHIEEMHHEPPGNNPPAPGWEPVVPDGENLPGPTPRTAEHRPPMPERHRSVFFGKPGLITIDIVIAILMLGFDIAIILLLRSQEEEEQKRRLYAANKEHELEHLKAQLNPHFFMNMLNNIHGMVEMDSVLAQEMIMDLSRLMRYVLYDGANSYTTLQHEKEFVGNYVELMRKRCSDTKVHIGMNLPQEPLDNVRIPPLLFISIIENAFKHGISYRTPSFVEVRMTFSGNNVTLECLNSIHSHSPRQCGPDGGVGLVNLRQRLQLLYGKAFTLEIENTENVYHVILTIPCEYETNTMPRH